MYLPKDNILDAYLVDMQLISKSNKRIRFLLSVFDICGKYAWAGHLKDTKGITITNAFPNVLDEWTHKPNKIRVYKGCEI